METTLPKARRTRLLLHSSGTENSPDRGDSIARHGKMKGSEALRLHHVKAGPRKWLLHKAEMFSYTDDERRRPLSTLLDARFCSTSVVTVA